MLRFEKEKKTTDISVALRVRQPLLNRPFLIALGIAVLMHGFALLIFHISSFLPENHFIFPPVIVNADAQTGETLASASDTLRLQKIEWLMPKQTRPHMPKISSSTPSSFLWHASADPDQPFNAFAALEFDLMNEAPPIAKKSNSMQILAVNGLPEPISVDTALSFNSSLPSRAIYEVAVENRTGTIFWMNPKETTGMPQLDALAEKLLKELQFPKNPEGFITLGSIELHFPGDAA